MWAHLVCRMKGIKYSPGKMALLGRLIDCYTLIINWKESIKRTANFRALNYARFCVIIRK